LRSSAQASKNSKTFMTSALRSKRTLSGISWLFRLCQKQHVADHFGHPVILFKTGVEDILKFLLGSILTQCDFSLRHQIGDGRSDLMRDIGREIGLAGKDVLNLSII
ncbi:hypothetical protein, partial [Escherichia coli]|uniref:hypothetical protein n=1 Tax=Escherichia coli TaxID=562 RepID=UPI003DA5DDED